MVDGESERIRAESVVEGLLTFGANLEVGAVMDDRQGVQGKA